MPQLIGKNAKPRARRRRRWRWTSDEKSTYLEAFRRSGLSVDAFCATTDLSPVTFAQWRRDGRRAIRKLQTAEAAAVTFARVECAPVERGAAMRMVVRAATGHEAALDGVDAPTAIEVVALLLRARR